MQVCVARLSTNDLWGYSGGHKRTSDTRPVPTYRIHDTTGDDLGVEHPASNVEPGDVVVLPDGREALATSRVEAGPGPLAGLLEVVIAPSRLEADDALP
jgi:hypothetical protein